MIYFLFFLQMPYLQSICLFTITLLHEADLIRYEDYSRSSTNINLYIQSVMTISFLCAMWGLFLIMDLTDKFKLIKGHRFRSKAAYLKIMVVFVNLQGLIINILVSFDVINCKGVISGKAHGGVISDLCSLIEAFILGNLTFYLNMKSVDHY